MSCLIGALIFEVLMRQDKLDAPLCLRYAFYRHPHLEHPDTPIPVLPTSGCRDD